MSEMSKLVAEYSGGHSGVDEGEMGSEEFEPWSSRSVEMVARGRDIMKNRAIGRDDYSVS